MYLRPASCAWREPFACHWRREPCELDQHRQIDPGNDLDASGIHHRNRQVRGGSAEHVGQDDDAIAAFDARNGSDNIQAPLVHIIFGSDADGFKCGLRPNHMLKGMPELFSELAMGDKHQSDHIASSSMRGATLPQPMPIASHLRIVCGNHLGQKQAKFKPKNVRKQAICPGDSAQMLEKQDQGASCVQGKRIGLRHRATDAEEARFVATRKGFIFSGQRVSGWRLGRSTAQMQDGAPNVPDRGQLRCRATRASPRIGSGQEATSSVPTAR
jgi:hypothetical protein